MMLFKHRVINSNTLEYCNRFAVSFLNFTSTKYISSLDTFLFSAP